MSYALHKRALVSCAILGLSIVALFSLATANAQTQTTCDCEPDHAWIVIVSNAQKSVFFKSQCSAAPTAAVELLDQICQFNVPVLYDPSLVQHGQQMDWDASHWVWENSSGSIDSGNSMFCLTQSFEIPAGYSVEDAYMHLITLGDAVAFVNGTPWDANTGLFHITEGQVDPSLFQTGQNLLTIEGYVDSNEEDMGGAIWALELLLVGTGEWERMSDMPYPNSQYSVADITMDENGDGWAVGSLGRVYRYDSTIGVWSFFDTWDVKGALNGVDMMGPEVVWAVGQNPKTSPAGYTEGKAFHRYDWQEEEWTFGLTAKTGGATLTDVDIFDPDYGWAVGYSGMTYRYDGQDWLQYDEPIYPDASIPFWNGDFYSVEVHEGQAWAVGRWDTPASPDKNAWVFKYNPDEDAWELYWRSKEMQRLTCIDLLPRPNGGNFGWIVGAAGLIYHMDDGDIRLHTVTKEHENFRTVCMVSETEAWAGGNGGYVYRYDGDTWCLHSQLDATVKCIYVDVFGNVWAGTANDAVWKLSL